MNQQRIFVKTDFQLKKINLPEIYFIEAKGNYVSFVAFEYREVVRITLELALNQLPQGIFAQVNRSIAVAIDRIDSIERDALRLDTKPVIEFTIGKKYYQGIVNHLKIIGVNVDDSEDEESA